MPENQKKTIISRTLYFRKFSKKFVGYFLTWLSLFSWSYDQRFWSFDSQRPAFDVTQKGRGPFLHSMNGPFGWGDAILLSGKHCLLFLTSNCLQIQFFLSQCTNSVSLYKYKYLCIVWVLFSQFCINVLLDNTDIVVSIFLWKKWQFIFHIEWDFSQFLLSHSTLRKREMNTAMVNGQNNVENVQEACFCLPAATTPSSSGENFFNGPFPPQVWLVKSSFFSQHSLLYDVDVWKLGSTTSHYLLLLVINVFERLGFY